MLSEKADFLSLNTDELTAFFKELGEPRYRAVAAFHWAHGLGITDFSRMTDMPSALRQKMGERMYITKADIKAVLVSADGLSKKYLLDLQSCNIMCSGEAQTGADNTVEAVYMRRGYGISLCVSSQIGCRMGCAFCESGAAGLGRNLTAGEMLAQVYAAIADNEASPGHIVIMGSGEPLDNFDNTVKFIRALGEEGGRLIGQRKITVSTCGLTDKIEALIDEDLQVTLAVSLHAADDDIRRRIMPVAKAYPLAELIKTCKRYGNITKRRVTYEYALIDGVNDSAEQAAGLAALIKGSLSHVNLFGVNNNRAGFKSAPKNRINAFAAVLRKSNIETTIRQSVGGDITAACGQLKRLINS